MTFSSALRRMRIGIVGTFLAGSLSVAGGAPIAVSAANTVLGTSTHALAYQHSAEDKVAYLHDGSLLVGYFDGNQVVIKRVANAISAPTTVENIAQGSEVTLYTLPGPSSTEIWIVVGNELYGGTKREQVQYITFNGTTFSLGTVYTIPGALTNGRQDPTVTWTGKWLIVSWWDDTMGGNSDTAFMNWTTDKTGSTGWLSKYGTTASLGNGRNGTTAAAVTLKSGTTAAATLVGASTISYTVGSGGAPAVGDMFEFGNGALSSEASTVTGVSGAAPYVLTVAPSLTNAHAMGEADTTATRITYTAVTGTAPAASDVFVLGSGTVNEEVATVTAVTGSAPYVLAVAPLTHNHAMGEIDTIQSWTITYTPVTGGTPVVGEWYQFGNGTNAEYRQLTGVAGTTITFAGLVNAHATGETDTEEAAIEFFTPVGHTIVQVSIRHSAKLGATIVVYGARSRLFTRTLLDTRTNPSLTNWSAESPVDPLFDDSEWGFGGPQVVIDEATGNIHVFRAVTTNGGPGWTGVTYWLGTPDATPMATGTVSWHPRLVIDSSAGPNDPPDIAGAIDSAGKVFVFWTTNAIGGTIKYATLVSPYTSSSPAVTVATSGSQPRFPHVPGQAALTRGIVPLVYQSGTSNPFSINLTAIPDFAGYNSLGGGLIGGPDASASSASRSDVFVRGTDNQLWHRSWNGATWASWEPLGGVLTADPGAVAVGTSTINVFVRGSDNQLWDNVWNGSTWGWLPLGGVLTSGPDADSWTGTTTHVDVYLRGTDNALWHKASDNGTWGSWDSLGGGLTSDPGAVSSGPNRADVFVRGTDNQLWHRSWNGVAWQAWEPLGGVLASGPDPASCASGHLDVFAIGTDGQLWRKGFNGASWGVWQPLGGMWTAGIGAVCNPGSGAIDVYTRGTDTSLWTISVAAT
jgi:hypothetical protein